MLRTIILALLGLALGGVLFLAVWHIERRYRDLKKRADRYGSLGVDSEVLERLNRIAKLKKALEIVARQTPGSTYSTLYAPYDKASHALEELISALEGRMLPAANPVDELLEAYDGEDGG